MFDELASPKGVCFPWQTRNMRVRPAMKLRMRFFGRIQDWILKSKTGFAFVKLNRLIQDHSDHGASKKPKYPCPKWNTNNQCVFFLSPFLFSHVVCSEVQSYLCGEASLPLPRASAVVIREILSMYSDVLAFLHSVVKLNTIFCFNLLQDQEALDRIVLLLSLDASFAGRMIVRIQSVV